MPRLRRARDPPERPAVLKALGRAHKSDGGGVALNLADEHALTAAFTATLAPVDHAYACDIINGLRIARLLNGYRGSPALDVSGLADIVVMVSQTVARTPAIAALELNPVLVRPSGAVALDRHWENVS